MARLSNYDIKTFLAQARLDAAQQVERERAEAERQGRLEILRMKRRLREERRRPERPQ